MFPNGSVITPDGTTLIVGETAGCRYTAFTIGADGSLTDRRVWAQLAPTPELGPLQEMLPQIAVGPDGCTLDAEGHIWAADEAGGRCIRIAPGGAIVDEIPTPEGLGCFACALGGDDGRTLLVCAAPDFLEANRREAREAVLLTATVEVPARRPALTGTWFHGSRHGRAAPARTRGLRTCSSRGSRQPTRCFSGPGHGTSGGRSTARASPRPRVRLRRAGCCSPPRTRRVDRAARTRDADRSARARPRRDRSSPRRPGPARRSVRGVHRRPGHPLLRAAGLVRTRGRAGRRPRSPALRGGAGAPRRHGSLGL